MIVKRLIMVVGMGRSGTSAIAKTLELCGARLPAALIPPNFANPQGYFEPETAVSINDDFLFRHGSSWYDPTMRLQAGDANVEDAALEGFVAAIAAFLRALPGEEPLVIKEPRITGLLPYWLEGAKRENYVVAFVIALRDPSEVSQSLLQRDRISREFSDVLWLKYSLLAERWSRSRPRVVVHFPSLMAGWESEMERIGKAIDIRFAVRARRDDVGSFLNADLYHHRRGTEVEEPAPLSLAANVYGHLKEATESRSLDEPALDAALGRYLFCDRRVRNEKPEFPRFAAARDEREMIPAWAGLGARLASAL